MRVVLDTNVLVSACWKPDGLEARVVQMARDGILVVCVSPVIFAEYRDVLVRRKLRSIQTKAEDLLQWLEAAAVLVEPTSTVAAATDEDDNRFLECAEAALAEALITGNLRHYPAGWKSTPVENARTFLTRCFPASDILVAD